MTRAAGPRFGLLLVSIGAVYVVVIASGSALPSGPVLIGLLGFALTLAVRLRGTSARWTRLVVAGAVLALVAGAVAVLTGPPGLALVLATTAELILVTASGALIARYLWLRPAVDRQTVGGALAVYLLLALFFAGLHRLLAAAHGPPYLDGVAGAADAAGYLYFSAVTLTTVGYGDITPACHAAQAVAIVEALTGQLYLVAVVGAVVGNWAGRVRAGRGPDR